MEEKTFVKACITTAMLLLIAGVLFFSGYLTGRQVLERAVVSPKVERDTVYLKSIPVRDTIILRSYDDAGEVVVSLPVAEVCQKEAEVCQERDSASVIVPIEQRVYEGEYYKATVEGYRPSLVDMQLKVPALLVTETRTVAKRKLWSVTIGPQLGYGITPAGLHPYAGVGVTFGLSF